MHRDVHSGKNQRERTSWLLDWQERSDLLKIRRHELIQLMTNSKGKNGDWSTAKSKASPSSSQNLSGLLLMLHHLLPSCSTFPFVACSRSWCPLSAQWRRLQQVCAQCECRTSSHVMRMSETWVWPGSHGLPSHSVTEATAVQCWADERGRCL